MQDIAQQTLARRDFIGSGVAFVGGAAGLLGTRGALGAPEDDWTPADIRYGTSCVAWLRDAESPSKRRPVLACKASKAPNRPGSNGLQDPMNLKNCSMLPAFRW